MRIDNVILLNPNSIFKEKMTRNKGRGGESILNISKAIRLYLYVTSGKHIFSKLSNMENAGKNLEFIFITF